MSIRWMKIQWMHAIPRGKVVARRQQCCPHFFHHCSFSHVIFRGKRRVSSSENIPRYRMYFIHRKINVHKKWVPHEWKRAIDKTIVKCVMLLHTNALDVITNINHSILLVLIPINHISLSPISKAIDKIIKHTQIE